MEKIKKLKNLFKKFHLDGYIIPKHDKFFNEYVSKKNDKLEYISNFSGSYGFALILKKKNYLFVDGRYTLQAKIQSGKFFSILKIPQKLPYHVLKNMKLSIGFDPKIFTDKILYGLFKNAECKLVPINKNLISQHKNKKIKKLPKKFFILNKKATGEGYLSKIDKVLKILKKETIDMLFVTASENIAWLLNLRGHDSEFSPIPNGYLIIDKESNVIFFCDLKKINNKIRKYFKKIKILDIKYVDLFLFKVVNKKIQIDANTCSFFFKKIIEKNNKIINKLDPIYHFKSIKNKTEIQNTIKSHIYDGAALTKFLFWVKNNYKKKTISEINAQEKLLKFRKNNKSFRSLSFPTISGSGINGAIIHYKANKTSNRVLSKGDLYLVDSGGQYNFGTTDVTRTISLENKSKRIKNIYTRVLKGHIAVSTFKITKKTTGSKIDLLARKPLKQIGLDYAHGTGHGVGYFLNVHEGPQSISKGNKILLKEGMILSNEPGYYENGKFGIRIENLITIKKQNKKLIFHDLTLAPIDKSMIEKKLMNKYEVEWLNKYHHKVYNQLKKFMNKLELIDLKKSCSSI